MRSWVAIPSATSYEISAQTGVGHPLGDGVNILPTTDVGLVLTLPTSTWLSGQELNQPYQIFVRAKNANEVGPWGQLNVTLIGELTAPVISKVIRQLTAPLLAWLDRPQPLPAAA
jgi:hypothetical protein